MSSVPVQSFLSSRQDSNRDRRRSTGVRPPQADTSGSNKGSLEFEGVLEIREAVTKQWKPCYSRIHDGLMLTFSNRESPSPIISIKLGSAEMEDLTSRNSESQQPQKKIFGIPVKKKESTPVRQMFSVKIASGSYFYFSAETESQKNIWLTKLRQANKLKSSSSRDLMNGSGRDLDSRASNGVARAAGSDSGTEEDYHSANSATPFNGVRSNGIPQGTPLPAPVAGRMGSNEEETMRQRVIAYLEQVRPDDISSVNNIFVVYRGRYNQLQDMLERKYDRTFDSVLNRPAEQSELDESQPSQAEMRRKLRAFYAIKNPSKIAIIDSILEDHHDYNALLAKIAETYRVSSVDAVIGVSRQSSSKSLQSHPSDSHLHQNFHSPSPSPPPSSAPSPLYQNNGYVPHSSPQRQSQGFPSGQQQMRNSSPHFTQESGGRPSAVGPLGQNGTARAAAPTKQGLSREEVKVKLERFYKVKNPAKLSTLDQILDSYADDYERLLSDLANVYQVASLDDAIKEQEAKSATEKASTKNMSARAAAGPPLTSVTRRTSFSFRGRSNSQRSDDGGEGEEKKGFFSKMFRRNSRSSFSERPSLSTRDSLSRSKSVDSLALDKTAEERREMRSLLEKFYAIADPGMVASVDNMLESYAPRFKYLTTAVLKELKEEVAAKYKVTSLEEVVERGTYNPPPPQPSADRRHAAVPPSPANSIEVAKKKRLSDVDQNEMKQRLYHFYAIYKPGNLTRVNELVENFWGQMAEIDAKLMDLYGHSPLEDTFDPAKQTPEQQERVRSTLSVVAGRQAAEHLTSSQLSNESNSTGPQMPAQSSGNIGTVTSMGRAQSSSPYPSAHDGDRYPPQSAPRIQNYQDAAASRPGGLPDSRHTSPTTMDSPAPQGYTGSQPMRDMSPMAAPPTSNNFASPYASPRPYDQSQPQQQVQPPRPLLPQDSRDVARQKIKQYYQAINPAKLTDIESVVDAYEGQYQNLYQLLAEKYGVTMDEVLRRANTPVAPSPPPAPSAPPTRPSPAMAVAVATTGANVRTTPDRRMIHLGDPNIEFEPQNPPPPAILAKAGYVPTRSYPVAQPVPSSKMGGGTSSASPLVRAESVTSTPIVEATVQTVPPHQQQQSRPPPPPGQANMPTLPSFDNQSGFSRQSSPPPAVSTTSGNTAIAGAYNRQPSYQQTQSSPPPSFSRQSSSDRLSNSYTGSTSSSITRQSPPRRDYTPSPQPEPMAPQHSFQPRMSAPSHTNSGSLSRQGSSTSMSQSRRSMSMKKCHSCAHSLPAIARFCNKCGTRL